ncbi:Aldolase-type TIM barrel [Penicillium argentinense]|uniref:Aldolase-type TIM barrel n=1 Tax=Penicillium argentinense TaxID=1131581 RepID=A0A9W9K3D7_9EURO|nr:Aldolase-type TIM barrel [Penicillium argentinense]KAJ5090662.1 Aldolase-type TIM barrel [Penicillium argentinense]
MQVDTRNTSTLPIVGPDKNKSRTAFVRPAQMSLFARVTSYPPLGQVTCLPRVQRTLRSEKDDVVRFTVVIESSKSFPDQIWETQIWHNISSSEWTDLPLRKIDPSHAPLLSENGAENSYHRHIFSNEIVLPSSGGHAQFTIRFRMGPDTDWQWANEQHPINDGEIVFCPRMPLAQSTSSNGKDELSTYIDNLSQDTHIESRSSEAPGSLLWSVSGDVPAATEASGTKSLVLGKPSSVTRNFSLVRVWSPWLGPRHGKDQFRLTEDAFLCSFLRKDGMHLVLLAVSGINDVLTVFRSGNHNDLVVKARNDNTETAKFQVLAAVAEDFEVALSALVYESRKFVRPFSEFSDVSSEDFTPVSPLGDDVVIVEKDPQIQWLTEWFDGLTYCTWNGLGQNLTEDKILQALKDLKSNGINISNLIIDDNWQSVDNEGDSQFKRRWQKFEANSAAFPDGLRQSVNKFRQTHPNIQHIGVWHALFGYWGGISPNSDLSKNYKTKEVKIKDPAADGPIAQNITDGKILAIDPDDIQQFYEDFYTFLNASGIDSVKADAQFFIDLLDDPSDRKKFTTAYQDAWSIAALKHFGTRAISCMSLIPQIMFHSQLPTTKPTIPLRNSDDFFPDVPAAQPWHVFCNAHNALFTRYLNALPDWDMFQTKHPYASFHAAARCISGGPVYITDEPGKHDLKLLDQMTAPTVHGTTVILRPSVIGRTIDVYNGYHEGRILRVGSYTGWAKTGSGILGLFNVQSGQTTCLVSLMDFPGIHEDSQGQYVIRAYTSGKVTGRMQPLDKDSLVSIVLEQKGWEILTAYPTQSFTLKGSRGYNLSGGSLTHVAVLGLLGKMTGAAAVVSSDIFIVENGRLRFDVHLKALGVLGVYFSDLSRLDIAKNFMVMILGRPVPPKTVWKEGGEDAKVLAIDVLAAWKAMKLDSGWSNEAFVQVFVG